MTNPKSYARDERHAYPYNIIPTVKQYVLDYYSDLIYSKDHLHLIKKNVK